MSKFELICLSHLRWDFVFQRPQQLLTRCAASGHRVIFVEEPEFSYYQSWLDQSHREPGIELLVPRLSWDDQANQSAVIERLLLEYLANRPVHNPGGLVLHPGCDRVRSRLASSGGDF